MIGWILLQGLSVLAAPPTLTITWSREGRDAEGISAFERLEVRPDRRVILQTAARRGLCSDEGGTYFGEVAAPVLVELSAVAEDAIQEQRSLSEVGNESANPSRVVRQRLEVERAGKVGSAPLNRETAKTRRLDALLDQLREKTRPQSVLKMSARRVAKSVRVTFELRGDRALRLLLPATAPEAFMAPGGAFGYARKPGFFDLLLTPENRIKEVDLEWSGKTLPTLLRYSNTLIRHHAEVDPPLRPSPPEAALCVTLR